MPQIYKVFASPGQDSGVEEYGVFASGAGRHPSTPTSKSAPTNWASLNPNIDLETGRLVGNFPITQAPNAKTLRIRSRGVGPFSGFIGIPSKVMLNVGGSVDHNAGADSHIAGGKGAASSLVRLQGGRPDRAMRLPVNPSRITRGGLAVLPQGSSGADGYAAAPLASKVPGFISIFSFVGAKAS